MVRKIFVIMGLTFDYDYFVIVPGSRPVLRGPLACFDRYGRCAESAVAWKYNHVLRSRWVHVVNSLWHYRKGPNIKLSQICREFHNE